MSNVSQKRVFVAVSCGIVLSVCGFIFAPQIKAVLNQKDYEVQKVNDATSYEKIKVVEDYCRAMITSYQADKLLYEQYKDSPDEQQKTWAGEAKIRANRTVATYNNYILQNSFVWKDNIPSDISKELEVIQ